MLIQEQEVSETLSENGATHAIVSNKLYCHFADFSMEQSPPGLFALSQSDLDVSEGITGKFISMNLTYLYKKAGQEVKFNSKKAVDKIAVEDVGIIFSKSRILAGMEFVELGDLVLTN